MKKSEKFLYILILIEIVILFIAGVITILIMYYDWVIPYIGYLNLLFHIVLGVSFIMAIEAAILRFICRRKKNESLTDYEEISKQRRVIVTKMVLTIYLIGLNYFVYGFVCDKVVKFHGYKRGSDIYMFYHHSGWRIVWGALIGMIICGVILSYERPKPERFNLNNKQKQRQRR